MTAQIRRRGRHARRYTTLRTIGGAVLLAVLVAAVFVTGAIAQPLPSQAASRPPAPVIGTYPRCLYGVAHGSGGSQCAMPDPTASLTRELLTVFYERGEPRSLLLHYYRWQQPGWPASMYGPYVRSLIIDYPRSVRSCLIALHHHVAYGRLGRICP